MNYEYKEDIRDLVDAYLVDDAVTELDEVYVKAEVLDKVEGLYLNWQRSRLTSQDDDLLDGFIVLMQKYKGDY